MAVIASQAWALYFEFEAGDLLYYVTSDASENRSGSAEVIGFSEAAKQRELFDLYVPNQVVDPATGLKYTCGIVSELAHSNNVRSIRFQYGISTIYYTGWHEALETVYIPSSVSTLGKPNGQDAFYKCSKLKDVYFTKSYGGLTGMAGGGIDQSSATVITVHYPLQETYDYIQRWSLKIGSKYVLDLDAYDHRDEDGTLSVTIVQPGSTNYVRAITGKEDVEGDNSVWKPYCQNGYYKIANLALKGNKSIKVADLSNLRTNAILGNSIFEDSNIETVKLPYTLGTSNIMRAFTNMPMLKEFVISNYADNFSVYDKCLYMGSTLVRVPTLYEKPEVDFMPGITKIDEMAFNGCANLTSINIPYGVTSVGHNAFWGCPELTIVTFPKSVTTFGRKMFVYCPKLNGIAMNHTTPKEFSKLESFLLSDQTFTLYVPYGKEADYRDAGWTEQYFPSINPNNIQAFDIRLGNFDYAINISSPILIDNKLFDGNCKVVKGIHWDCLQDEESIPEYVVINNKKYAVTSIGQYGIATTSKPFSISGGINVKDIYASACERSAITAIDLPNVLTVGNLAFANASSLTSANLGDKFTTLGARALYGTAITNFTVPASCTTIGKDAFSYNTALNELTLLGDKMKTFTAAFVSLNADVTKITVKSDLLYDYYQAMAGWKVSANKTVQDRLAPYIIPEHDTQMFSACTQLNAPTGVKLNYMTARDASTGIATSATLGYVFAGYGYLLTGLTPGQMYKFTPNNTSNARMPNNLLRDVATTPLDLDTVANAYVWNAVDKVFEKPAAGTTLPSSSAYLLADDDTAAKYYADLFPAPTPDYKLGDVNGDDVVDVSDINVLINIILGSDSADNYAGRADLTGDGSVDVSDLNAVIDIVLGN